MMIDPPVDKLINKVGCKYALVCLVTKRARYLLEKKSESIGTSATKAINVAAQEIFNDQIIMVED